MYKKYKIKLICLGFIFIGYIFCLPRTLFKSSTSTVVTASNNELLGAVIADDGQWRFPEIDTVPYKFEQCILQFEDAHFYKHFGFNPVSIVKALSANIQAGKVVRGGSTLTQQVIRLSRKNTTRSYIEKLKELILATRLEFRYSKKSILKLYSSHAPFGGNVVGLEMAAWRYFGLQPNQLSWAESATLAVLPNAPSLIYPGKNQQKLKRKRDKLLKKLYEKDIIDAITYELAIEEDLPQKPYPLPVIANHFVQEVAKEHKGKQVQSTIDVYLQKQINALVKKHYERQRQNEVYNMAVLVLDVTTRKVVAYVGNSPTDKGHQKDVNNVISGRSTGSILKPLLYAHMLQDGELLPNQLVADIPTQIAGYTPKNYNKTFDGAVPLHEALTRSLNIPAVRLLKKYGLQKFRDDLTSYQITHMNKSADYYGLSLILGGGEASLWDLCKIFAGISGTVNHYEALQHQYYTNEFVTPSYLKDETVDFGTTQKETNFIDAGSSYLILEALTNVNRTEEDQAWKYYDSSKKVAWKSGTSFGNRDAWAIGTTSKYVVGVWIGNSDGEGRPGLTGVGSASPLLFDVFGLLPNATWFLEPYEDLIEERICNQSGYLALPICEATVKRIQKNGNKGISCPYHKEILVDKSEEFRVNTNCESIENIQKKTWFILPSIMAYYYQQKNATYKTVPAYKKSCNTIESNKMSFIFPTTFISKVSLTKGFDNQLNSVVLKLTHSNDTAIVYWYVDDIYIRMTEKYHELAIEPKKGTHIITAIDNLGNELKRIMIID